MYSATTLADLDPTKPLGSEPGSNLDDALRETRRVLKNELGPILASADEEVTNPVGDVVATYRGFVWVAQYGRNAIMGDYEHMVAKRREMTGFTTFGKTACVTAGDHTNSIKPSAGTYLVDGYFLVHNVHSALGYLTASIGNPTELDPKLDDPSDNTAYSGGLHTYGNETNLSTFRHTFPVKGVFVANGTSSYCFAVIPQRVNLTATMATAHFEDLPSGFSEFPLFATYLTFLKIG